MEGAQKRKIINFSIKKQLQVRLFIKVFGIILSGVGLMAVLFYFYSNREISESYRQFHIQANNFLDLLLPAILAAFLLCLFISAAIALFLPIKIAGPLFRLEKDLIDRVAEGDLTVRFTLRKGDELGDLAESINFCMDSLSRKIEQINKSADDLESAAVNPGGLEKSDFEHRLAKLNENLRQFKVS